MSVPAGIRIPGKDRHIFTQKRRMPGILNMMIMPCHTESLRNRSAQQSPQEKFQMRAYSLTAPANCTIQPVKSTSHFFNGGI